MIQPTDSNKTLYSFLTDMEENLWSRFCPRLYFIGKTQSSVTLSNERKDEERVQLLENVPVGVSEYIFKANWTPSDISVSSFSYHRSIIRDNGTNKYSLGGLSLSAVLVWSQRQKCFRVSYQCCNWNICQWINIPT